MDVFRSAAVLHTDTEAAIKYLVEYENWPEEALTTGFFCGMVSKWFKIITCRTDELAFSKHNVEKRREQVEFLEEFIDFIATIKFKKNQQAYWAVQKGKIKCELEILKYCTLTFAIIHVIKISSF